MPRLSTERLWVNAPKGSPTGRGRLSPATGVAWDSVGPKAAERKNSAASGERFLLVSFLFANKEKVPAAGQPPASNVFIARETRTGIILPSPYPLPQGEGHNLFPATRRSPVVMRPKQYLEIVDYLV